jgi:hypothetical protein
VLATPPPPHVSGAVQLPQLTVRPPHPSDCAPHVPGKSAHVFGVHRGGPPPHTLGVPPPPHVAGAVHVPQLGVSPPHPSLCTPHDPGYDAHDFATHGDVL